MSMIHRHKEQRLAKKSTVAATEKVETKAAEPVSANANETATYTKTDIMRMSKADLVKLAVLYDISGADELSGSKLKEALIEHLAL